MLFSFLLILLYTFLTLLYCIYFHITYLYLLFIVVCWFIFKYLTKCKKYAMFVCRHCCCCWNELTLYIRLIVIDSFLYDARFLLLLLLLHLVVDVIYIKVLCIYELSYSSHSFTFFIINIILFTSTETKQSSSERYAKFNVGFFCSRVWVSVWSERNKNNCLSND